MPNLQVTKQTGVFAGAQTPIESVQLPPKSEPVKAKYTPVTARNLEYNDGIPAEPTSFSGRTGLL